MGIVTDILFIMSVIVLLVLTAEHLNEKDKDD
jgi:hypothetical protein